jgi:hypothetical protein
VVGGPSLFDIRTWGGTQQKAFEELCFQLREPDPAGSRSTKPGSPDRGVDWYVVTADGHRLGRQCKFVNSIDKALPQMRESLETALRELPDLVEMEFYVPFDVPEATPPARGGGRKSSARERWTEATERWREDLDGAGRLQTIELVDAPKILERLTADKHRGRLWFFFDRELFGVDWCRRQLEKVRKFVGPRYRPDLHVALPIGYALDGLARSERFERDVAQAQRALLTTLQSLDGKGLDLLPQGESLSSACKAFAAAASTFRWTQLLVSERLPIRDARHAAARLEQALLEAGDAFAEAEMAEAEMAEADAEKPRETLNALAATSRRIGSAHSALRAYRSQLMAAAAEASDSATLLIHGGAGEGKTHLLCDAAERLLDEGHPAVVLLGGHFLPSSPAWSTVASELGVEGRGYELLVGAMEAAAEVAGRRFVLLIDALNEADEPGFWKQQLETIRVHAAHRGLIGVGASCRTTYLEVVGIKRDETPWTIVEHRGLEGREEEAAARYFGHYGVQAPRVPLLHPDLTTPLFLKLYCEGLRGKPAPAKGEDTATAIFERLIETHAETINDRLDLDPDDRVPQRAVGAFAAALIDAGHAYLTRDAARDLFSAILPTRDRHPLTLFHQLLDTGLLSRDIVRDEDKAVEVVRFAYNRFSDHVIAEALLDRHVDPDQALDAFVPGAPLHEWVISRDSGVVEALTNQVPERTGLELVDAVQASDNQRPYRSWMLRLLIRALPHRKHDAIGPRTVELLTESGGARPLSETFELLCQLAPNPDHPLGGDLLHRNLVRGTMATRDAAWGSLLDKAGDPRGAMARLLSWAQRGPYPDYDGDVIEAACLPLVWLLSTPNRPARDHATKVLAQVLQRHLRPATALVRRFARVQEPYVHERLAAVAHGAVLRGGYLDRAAALELFEAMTEVWLDGDLRPDPLTRDAVRGVAEWLHRDKLIDGERLAAVSPPYNSKRVAAPRTKRWLDERYASIAYNETGIGYEGLWRAIEGSMGDRMRQTIAPAVQRFLRVPRGTTPPPPPDPSRRLVVDLDLWDEFVASLADNDRSVLDENKPGLVPVRLRMTLTPEQDDVLKTAVHVESDLRRYEQTVSYAVEWIERWLFQRAISMGWTPERFGSHDRYRGATPRGRSRYEGYAEKYVHIAFRELVARLSDHHAMRERHGREPVEYRGPWQLGLREVDPTMRPSEVEIDDEGEARHLPPFPLDSQDAWWVGHDVTWAPGDTVDRDWGALASDLPSLPECVRPTDPGGQSWVRLDGHTGFVEPPDPTRPESPSSIAGRDLGFSVQALLVGADDLPSVLSCLRRDRPEQNPDAVVGQDAYLGESPWAAAAEQPEWTWEPRPGWTVELPADVLIATGDWSWTYGSDDASLAESVMHSVPARELWSAGRLSWRGGGPEWHLDDRLVLQSRRSTGVYRDIQRGMLACEEWLGEVLRRQGWGLAIRVVGEKHLYTDSAVHGEGIASWLLFGAAVGFDGGSWNVGDWTVFEHPPGHIEIDDSDAGVTVAGDPMQR